MLRCNKALLAALAALPAAALPTSVAAQVDVSDAVAAEASRPTIALMGTIPIYWGEVAGLDEMLSGSAHRHWARAVLERQAELAPIDYLSAEALAPYRYLLLAQPRGFSAEENVALDAWVRNGGQVLLFADPWMTGESRFGIGDRRRPQAMALLSPILAHWGLELVLEEQGQESIVYAEYGGQLLPGVVPGRLVSLAGSGPECVPKAAGLLASCAIGQGRALIMADAAMLDLEGPYPHADTALAALLAEAFAEIGDHAGNTSQIVPEGTGSEGIREQSGAIDPVGTSEIGGRSSSLKQ